MCNKFSFITLKFSDTQFTMMMMMVKTREGEEDNFEDDFQPLEEDELSAL